jgi:hypothetical protein
MTIVKQCAGNIKSNIENMKKDDSVRLENIIPAIVESQIAINRRG